MMTHSLVSDMVRNKPNIVNVLCPALAEPYVHFDDLVASHIGFGGLIARILYMLFLSAPKYFLTQVPRLESEFARLIT